MTHEQMLCEIEEQRRIADLLSDPEEREEEQEKLYLEDKPERNVLFNINYYGKLQALYIEEKLFGDKMVDKKCEDDYEYYLQALNEDRGERPNDNFWRTLGTCWAIKDYMEGDA